MAYGFSGWMAYYLWFNHFMEVAVVFPLVLLGIEKLLKDKNFRFLAFSLFLMGITNYFFLVSTSFTAVFYAIFRYLQTAYQRPLKSNLTVALYGLLAFATGIMMSAFVFLPSVMVAITSNRVGEAWYLDQLTAAYEDRNWQQLWSILTVWQNQSGKEEPYNQFYPLVSFLFPTVSNRSSTLFKTGRYDNTISSLFIYTPLTMLLLPSLIHNLLKKKWSHLLGFSIVLLMLFTPFTYQLVHGFTIDYGRWQIFVVTITITYIAIHFEQRMSFKRWYYDVSFVTILGLALYAVYVALEYENKFFFSEMEERQYVAVFALLYMITVYWVLRKDFQKKTLPETIQTAIFFEAIVMGTLIMNMHGLISYPNRLDNGLELIEDQRDVVKKIYEQDDDFFRIYNLNAGESTNLGMRLGYNGLTAFHSLYNFHLSDFNNYSRMNYDERGWSMGYHEKRYNLDLFLGIKYYIMQNNYDWHTKAAEVNPVTGIDEYLYQNVPFGFEKDPFLSTNKNSVYVNKHFIEGGLTHDTLYPNNQVEGQIGSRFFNYGRNEVLYNEEIYLTGTILANKDVDDILEDAPHLEVVDLLSQSIERIYTQVKTITCKDTKGNPIIFDPAHVKVIETCEQKSVNTDSPINQFNGEFMPIHLTPSVGNTFGDNELFFFSLQLSLDHHATVYFFDESNEIIIRDAHSFVSTSFKFMRGYYPNRPVSRIVIVPKYNEDFMYYPKLYREPYAAFLSRLNNLEDYPITNFKHTKNTRTFSTNFQTSRFIVLNTAFDPGWRVERMGQGGQKDSTPVYLSQGGFVGFLSGVGPTDYIVRYWTPYLSEGLLISLAGFAIFGGVIGASVVIEKRRRDQEN
jgi:uncharacterized membrane protein YfhO